MSAVIHRLLDALDALANEAAAPMAADDWENLVALIERENAVVEGLAAQVENQPEGADRAALRTRVAALLSRYEARAQQVAAAAATAHTELRELRALRRQMHAVRSAYRYH